MAFIDDYDFDLLKNEAEKLVIDELESQLKSFNNDPICTCNDCVLDMATMALNMVKPIYRVSLLGSLYAARAMDKEDYAKHIRDSVKNAIEKVVKNPSHDIKVETEEG